MTDAAEPESKAPDVGVIMGSDSDWSVLMTAAEVLASYGVSYEVRVVSAHRTPQDMLDYASRAADRGLRVIIAGAGGAAHLPGMVASATRLPVIGVPVPLAQLDGLASPGHPHDLEPHGVQRPDHRHRAAQGDAIPARGR